jgi:hypothetical protein
MSACLNCEKTEKERNCWEFDTYPYKESIFCEDSWWISREESHCKHHHCSTFTSIAVCIPVEAREDDPVQNESRSK